MTYLQKSTNIEDDLSGLQTQNKEWSVLEKNTSDLVRSSNNFEIEEKETVHMTLVDHSPRTCNFVVTGFTECDDKDRDSGAFTDICVMHFRIKSSIVRNRGCIHLSLDSCINI